MKICIIGKSKRLDILKENMIKQGINVETMYTSEQIGNRLSADFIVLPIPTVNKNGYLNIDGKYSMTIDDLLEKTDPNTTVISCNYKESNRKIIDLNDREDFAYMNAVPTAEGAIFYALQNSERSLYDSKILITGFGRVAKLLADRLRGLSCDITVAARSLRDLSYAKALGLKTLEIKALAENIKDFNLIFQTVPSLLINDKVIDSMGDGSIVIELSSKSVGTDYEYAKAQGVTVIHAPALPEKISPITAGNILTQSVLSIIAELQ